MMRPSIRRPQPALTGTFEANGIVGLPRLLTAHRGRGFDRRRAPPALGGAHCYLGAPAAQKSWPSTRQAIAEQRSCAYSISRNVTRM
jgi:hypothetical protein